MGVCKTTRGSRAANLDAVIALALENGLPSQSTIEPHPVCKKLQLKSSNMYGQLRLSVVRGVSYVARGENVAGTVVRASTSPQASCCDHNNEPLTCFSSLFSSLLLLGTPAKPSRSECLCPPPDQPVPFVDYLTRFMRRTASLQAGAELRRDRRSAIGIERAKHRRALEELAQKRESLGQEDKGAAEQ